MLNKPFKLPLLRTVRASTGADDPTSSGAKRRRLDEGAKHGGFTEDGEGNALQHVIPQREPLLHCRNASAAVGADRPEGYYRVLW
jgi:hypothetical protein